jgi:hypothetical protein
MIHSSKLQNVHTSPLQKQPPLKTPPFIASTHIQLHSKESRDTKALGPTDQMTVLAPLIPGQSPSSGAISEAISDADSRVTGQDQARGDVSRTARVRPGNGVGISNDCEDNTLAKLCGKRRFRRRAKTSKTYLLGCQPGPGWTNFGPRACSSGM